MTKSSQWVLVDCQDDSFRNVIGATIKEMNNGKTVLVLTEEQFQRNLSFIRNCGYRLHAKSPCREDGTPNVALTAENASAMPDASKEMVSASLIIPKNMSIADAPISGAMPDAVAGSQFNPFSVLRISTEIGKVIKQGFGNTPFWVRGEIAGNKAIEPGKHNYFQLIEVSRDGVGSMDNANDKVVINTVMFQRTAAVIAEQLALEGRKLPQPGEEICAKCTVAYYDKKSNVQLVIQDIDPHFAEGEFFREKQKILGQLMHEGLGTRNKSIPFPALPLRLAVFSSRDADGWGDFQSILRGSGYPFRITFFQINVQGRQVEATFLDMFQKLRMIGESRFDLAVVLRGGGSLKDLAWFNNYPIAKTIESSSVKWICGIGHESNRCVLDEILESCVTPTDAAKKIVSALDDRARLCEDKVRDLDAIARASLLTHKTAIKDVTSHFATAVKECTYRENILQNQLANQLKGRSEHFLAARKYDLSSLVEAVRSSVDKRIQLESTKHAGMVQSIQQKCQNQLDSVGRQVTNLAYTLDLTTKNILDQAAGRLDLFEKLIAASDPRELLRRGFVPLTMADGQRITSITQAHTGDELRATLIDGSLSLSVQNIHEKDHE